jgi:cytochrome P450 family 110
MQRLLGVAEHFFWLCDQNAPVHFALAARINGSFSLAQLRQSLSQVQLQHPLLRVGISITATGHPEFIEQTVPIPLRLVVREDEYCWQREIEIELSRSFDWQTAPLVRVVLLHSETVSELIVVAHHAIADGMSIAYLIRDIVKGLESAGTGLKPLSQAPPMDQFIPIQEGVAPPQALVLPEYCTVASSRPRPRVESVLLSTQLTQQICDRARQENTTVHGAISAAFLLTIARQGKSTLKCQSPINARFALVSAEGSDLPLSVHEAIGVYISYGVTQHDLSEETSLWQVARSLKSQLSAALLPTQVYEVFHRVQNQTALLPEAKTIYEAARSKENDLVVTNLGRLPFEQSFGSLQIEAIHGPVVLFGAERESAVGVATLGDRLSITVCHPSAIDSETGASVSLAEALKILREGVIMKISNQETITATELPNQISSPAWRQLIDWVADPLGFQDKYSRKYGDIFTMTLGSLETSVIIGNPQAVQDIFSQDSKFDQGRGNEIAEPLIGRNSLMLLDGDRHRRERKLLMPPFHGERLQTYTEQICTIAKQVAGQWQVGQPFVARSAMQQISLEVILQVVFGLSQGNRYQQLKPLLTEWLDMTDSPLRSSILFFRFLQRDWGAWSPWGRMKQRQRQVHDLLQAEIEERRTQGNEGQSDVLSLMMAARDENGQAMSDAELRDELVSMLFAGHETTASSLAWAFYQIHRQPTVHQTLLEELDSIGKDPGATKVTQIPYLNAVCQETLRMYPVLPVIFPRITQSPIKIAGHWFESDTKIYLSNYLVHYREDLYPNAQQFKPERFLERQYSAFEYFPFGGGNRRCLGYALAQLEMKLVLATILSRYQLALAENQPVTMQRRGFTIAPRNGVRMVMMGQR